MHLFAVSQGFVSFPPRDAVSVLRPTIIVPLYLIVLVAAFAPTRAADPARFEQGQVDAPAANQPTEPPFVQGQISLSREASGGEYDPSESPADRDERPRLNAFWDHGAVLESSDKTFRLHVGGRMDFDNTWYQYTQSLPFTLQDGSDIRRARLRADGTVGENVDFATEVNFANIQDVTNEDTTAQIGSVGLTDFYVTFRTFRSLKTFA